VEFNVEVKIADKWYCVTDVGFRFHKNHPSDGINYIKILDDLHGCVETESFLIEDIRFNVWR